MLDSGLQLIRFVKVVFNKEVVVDKDIGFKTDNIEVYFNKVDTEGSVKDKKKCIYIIEASIVLKSMPKLKNKNEASILLEQISELEKAAETAANILSIKNNSSAKFYSPTPYLAIFALTDKAKLWLKNVENIHVEQARLMLRPAVPSDAGFDIFGQLDDRTAGITLLANAQSKPSITDYCRLFENAFGQQFDRNLAGKMSAFLSDKYGYQEDEINKWVELRGGGLHADFKKSQVILFERDFLQYIPRIEQAALDIFFNKKDWLDKSKARTERFHATCGTYNSKGDIFIEQGTPWASHVYLYDVFNSYPLHNDTKFEVPEGMVILNVKERGSSGLLKIIEKNK